MDMNTRGMDFSERLSLEDISKFAREEGGKVFGHYGSIRLKSAFQPIYSLAHRRAVGFEALLRPYAGDQVISPLTVFGMVQDDVENVFLDRLCRIVHLKNFLSQGEDINWIFLNINPKVTVVGRRYGGFFADLLEHNRIAPHRVVVEILESQIQDEGLLSEAVNYYKELGCLIAIDDFGAGESNFDRLWRIEPHIVKLDRSIICQAASNVKVRRVIPNLVKLIHETGSLALMEGVETEDEAMISMNSGADFVQGYYFARPAERLSDAYGGSAAILGICEKFRHVAEHESDHYRKALHPYIGAFSSLVEQFKAGVEMDEASRNFLGLSKAERCFILNGEGRQLGSSVLSSSTPNVTDPRFTPLLDANDAIWLRRHYFRRAMSNPGEIQISRPYLSIAGGKMCVTLSVALHCEEERLVLCGDILWND
ncbi:MAG: EAL domain-containing protein [Burkholderiales bacterium]|nr:EAL domain-containing protein [Burkholderiales bacterium]